MKITLVLLRPMAVGLALAFGVFAHAREAGLDHFKPTNSVSLPQIREIQAFLKRLEHEEPPSGGAKRIAWFKRMMAKIPVALLNMEPLEYDPTLKTILTALGRAERVRFVDLLIAQIVNEVAATPLSVRRACAEGLLESALALPLDQSATSVLARVIEHLLDEDYLRLMVLGVLKKNSAILIQSPDLAARVFEMAVDIPPQAKRAFQSAAAFRVLATRPELLRPDQLPRIERTKRVLSRMAWMNETSNGVNRELIILVDELTTAYLRDYAPAGRHYVIEEVFETDRRPTAEQVSAVRALLSVIAEERVGRRGDRARWWIAVAPLITPYISDLHLNKEAPKLARLFRGTRQLRGVRFGFLVTRQLHAELTGVSSEWSSRREFLRPMLDAALLLPRTDISVSFLNTLMREWLTDDTTRGIVFEAIRQIPMLLHTFPDVRADILSIATVKTTSRSDLPLILMALDVLKSQASSLSDAQLQQLADGGRRMIEARWESGNALARMTVRGAFEDFASMLDYDSERSARFLRMLRPTSPADEPAANTEDVPVEVNAHGLRIHHAEYSLKEYRQISVFLNFASTFASRPEADHLDLWWQVLTHRLPECMMNIEIVGRSQILGRLLGVDRSFRPGARLGEVLIAQLFEDMHAPGAPRPGYIENLLKAAFNLPVHILTLNGLSHYVTGMLQDEHTREQTLEVLIGHPKVLRLSAAIRDEVVHLVDHREDGVYGPRTLILALRALATIPDALHVEQAQKIFGASRDVESGPWTIEAMNDVVDAVHILAVAVNSGEAPGCGETLAVSRW